MVGMDGEEWIGLLEDDGTMFVLVAESLWKGLDVRRWKVPR